MDVLLRKPLGLLALEQADELSPLTSLQDKAELLFILEDIVELHDVRMVDGVEEVNFVLEPYDVLAGQLAFP